MHSFQNTLTADRFWFYQQNLFFTNFFVRLKNLSFALKTKWNVEEKKILGQHFKWKKNRKQFENWISLNVFMLRKKERQIKIATNSTKSWNDLCLFGVFRCGFFTIRISHFLMWSNKSKCHWIAMRNRECDSTIVMANEYINGWSEILTFWSLDVDFGLWFRW